MPRLSKLNDIQKEDVWEWFAKGNPAHTIMQLLKEKYNIEISHATISKFLKSVKDQRKEATDMAYKDAAAKSVNRDLSIIDARIDQLNTIAVDLLNKKDYKLGKDISEVLLKFISKKMDLNLTPDNDPKTKDLLDSLLNKIENK